MPRMITFGAAALCLAVAGADTRPAGANPKAVELLSPLNVPNPKNVPATRKNAPPPQLSKFLTRLGILNCTSVAAEECMVNAMPLVSQGDPRLLPVTKNYLSKFTAPGAPDTLKASLPISGGKKVAGHAQAILDNGCLLASSVTVINAALANREKSIAPINRTKEFDAIAGTTDMPKALNQVAWAYQRAFDSWNNITSGGKAVEVFFFPEVVADVGGGKIGESCDPYDFLACAQASAGSTAEAGYYNTFGGNTPDSNAKVINGMKKHMLYVLAYGRYGASAVFDKDKNTVTVSFSRTSQHKVPVSGFQPGKYPLLINDVGNGKRVRARLSNDLKTLAFGPRLRAGQNPTFVYGKDENGNSLENRPFLVYEGDDSVLNPTVFFLDEVMTLRVKAPLQVLPKPADRQTRPPLG